MRFNEYCPYCVGEMEMEYKGFVIHKCPECGEELKPCSICDAYTDNPVKIYASSCEKCPFECHKKGA